MSSSMFSKKQSIETAKRQKREAKARKRAA
jgi:hypothetical protein